VGNAALGLRAHSGWAALVAVAGTRGSIEVVDRRRLELSASKAAGPRQPYHEAEGQKIEKARQIVTRYSEEAGRLATEGFRAVLADLKNKGHDVVGCGLLVASGRPLPALESILASHALIHSADGELFRDALAGAAKRHRLNLVRAREKEVVAEAASRLRLEAEDLQRRVAGLGKTIGPPWTQDQKLAAIAAWLALVSETRGKS
jgi:hypothetical protein